MRRALTIAAALIALLLIRGEAAGESSESAKMIPMALKAWPCETESDPTAGKVEQETKDQRINIMALRGGLSASDRERLDSFINKKAVGYGLLVPSGIWLGLMALRLSKLHHEPAAVPVLLAVPGLILGGVSIGLIRDGQKGIRMLAEKDKGMSASLGFEPLPRGGAISSSISF